MIFITIVFSESGAPQSGFRNGMIPSVTENVEFRCDKCGRSFQTEEGLRVHSIGAGDTVCIENEINTIKPRPRKGPTGIGKKSGGKGRGQKKDGVNDKNKCNLEPSVITFENDDANMSRPVSPSKNKDIAIADCFVTEPLNCAIDVNNLKVEANSMSSSEVVFKTSISSSAMYDYNNSLSSNASISLPVAVKSEAIYDSNSQPALGAASSGIDTWKCNQCKVAFESGPQLLEHLDEIRRAEHKVTYYEHILFKNHILNRIIFE